MKTIMGFLSLCTCLLTGTAVAVEKSKTNEPIAKSAAVKTMRTVSPAETIKGKLTMVEPGQKLVIVKATGVPYDILVTPSTRVVSGGHRITLNDLNADPQKSVSVRFIPERKGDVARSIDVLP